MFFLGFSRKYYVLLASLMLALSFVVSPASAGKKGVGSFLGGVGVGVILNEMSKGLTGEGEKSEKPRRKKSDDEGGGNGGGESGKSSSKQAEQQLLEASTNHVEEEEARRRIEQNEVAERNRNVEKAIAHFIDVLEAQHRVLRGQMANVRVSSGDGINQVTAGEVRSEVERAYLEAKLTDFDQFAGELWTRDRLTVQILRETERGIEPYFEGVGAKGPSVGDLKTVFSKSAGVVHARALELAEIVGVSHSFDRFIRTIYENSDRSPESLWTIGADGRYERLLSHSINTINRAYFITDSPVLANDPLGLERLFQFRFRARRALYDCLSSRYASIAADRALSPTMGAFPTLVIEESMSGQQVGRGVALASAQSSPKPATAEPYASGANAGQQEVWRQVQTYVHGECNAPVMQIADSARRDGLQPVPARWDAGSAAQQMNGPPLMQINDSRPQ